MPKFKVGQTVIVTGLGEQEIMEGLFKIGKMYRVLEAIDEPEPKLEKTTGYYDLIRSSNYRLTDGYLVAVTIKNYIDKCKT